MGVHSYTCGVPFPSGCVLATAKIPSFIDAESLACDLRLDGYLEAINDKLEEVFEGLDLTEINKNCFDFDPATVKIKEVIQELLDKDCEHETRLTTVEEQLNELDIASKLIEIDLGCLAPAAAACEQGTNVYTLLSILLTLKNEICEIKNYLNL